MTGTGERSEKKTTPASTAAAIPPSHAPVDNAQRGLAAELFHEALDARRPVAAVEVECTLERLELPARQRRVPLELEPSIARLRRGPAVEGMLAGEQLVRDAAERIDVVAGVGFFALSISGLAYAGVSARRWPQPCRCSDNATLAERRHRPGDAEVDDLDLAVAGHDARCPA